MQLDRLLQSPPQNLSVLFVGRQKKLALRWAQNANSISNVSPEFVWERVLLSVQAETSVRLDLSVIRSPKIVALTVSRASSLAKAAKAVREVRLFRGNTHLVPTTLASFVVKETLSGALTDVQVTKLEVGVEFLTEMPTVVNASSETMVSTACRI